MLGLEFDIIRHKEETPIQLLTICKLKEHPDTWVIAKCWKSISSTLPFKPSQKFWDLSYLGTSEGATGYRLVAAKD